MVWHHNCRMLCCFASFTKDFAIHFLHSIQHSRKSSIPKPVKTTKDRCLDLATVERVSTSPNTHLSFKIKGDIGFKIEQRRQYLFGICYEYQNKKNIRKYLSKKYLRLHTHKKHEPFIFR